MKTCYSELAIRPLLYNDTISGKQISRDDMWAVTTDELNELKAKMNKSYADGVIAGQRQLANTIEMVQESIFKK